MLWKRKITVYYIYVKIYARPQLYVINREVMSHLDKDIVRINEENGGFLSRGREGVFCYSAYYKETLLNLLQTAFSLSELLESFRDDLDGYNIVVTKSDVDDYRLDKRLQFLVIQILQDGGVWIDPECMDEVGPYLLAEKEFHLYRADHFKENGPSLSEMGRMILTDEEKQKEIHHWFDKGFGSLLFLIGPSGSGKKLNLDSFIEEKSSSLHVLRFESPLRERGLFEPFMKHLRSREEIVRLSGQYEAFWEELMQGQILSRCSDYFDHDFEEALNEYLELCRERAVRSGRVLLLVLSGMGHMSALSRELMLRIIRKAGSLRGVKIVILENDKNASYLGDFFSRHTISFSGDSDKDGTARFHLAYLNQLGREPEEGQSLIPLVVGTLNESEKKLLDYIALAEGMFSREELASLIMEKEDMGSLVYEQLNRLVSLLLVKEDGNGHPYCDFETESENQERIVDRLIERMDQKDRSDIFSYYHFLVRHGRVEKALGLLNLIMSWLINNGFREKAGEIIDHPPFSDLPIDASLAESIQNLMYINRLRINLQEESREGIEALISQGILSQISERGQFVEDYYLQLARYYCLCGNTDQTLNYAKEALFIFQKKGNHLGESLANIELAFAFLGQKKIQSAIDYFEIARRISYQIGDNFTLISAHVFGALSAFLFGNLSKSESMAEAILPLAVRNGNWKRVFFLKFLMGRIYFEYGRYREGADFFMDCASLAERFSFRDGGDTAKRWAGRCLIYLEKRREAIDWLSSDDDSREGLYFLAEADYMVSLYESALKRLDQAAERVGESPMGSYSERDIWTDGFMPIEGRLSSRDGTEDVLTEHIRGMKAHILSLTDRRQEASSYCLADSPNDYPFKPYSHHYNYLKFTILNEGDIPLNGDDRRLAFLSKAIERLQSRAGRFDHQRKKLDFLNRNWWNKRIIEEAHKKKFI